MNRLITTHVGRDGRNLQIGHSYLLDAGRPIHDFEHLSRVCLDSATWSYMLGVTEQTHLLQHPLDNVRPNSGVGFGTCTVDHKQRC